MLRDWKRTFYNAEVEDLISKENIRDTQSPTNQGFLAPGTLED
jgi:hypothetical protein